MCSTRQVTDDRFFHVSGYLNTILHGRIIRHPDRRMWNG